MRVLIMFEEIPESLMAYVVVDPTEEELVVLEAGAGKYINDNDNGDANIVMDWVQKKDEFCSEVGAIGNCKWKDCEVTIDRPIEGPFDKVYVMGIHM